ncbi:MAG TPA: hypothetical protein VEZ90_05310 [Blastocatellia bacterium]|nr:hypothetical protein [Blastocatellia bacterium]
MTFVLVDKSGGSELLIGGLGWENKEVAALVKKPPRGYPLRFRLALDVLHEMDQRSGPRERGLALERSARRYVMLTKAGRQSLANLFTEDELRFLAEIYPGLLLDDEKALPLAKQVAQALEISGAAAPDDSKALLRKLKLDVFAMTALLDAIEQGRSYAAARERRQPDFAVQAGRQALRVLNGR